MYLLKCDGLSVVCLNSGHQNGQQQKQTKSELFHNVQGERLLPAAIRFLYVAYVQIVGVLVGAQRDPVIASDHVGVDG